MVATGQDFEMVAGDTANLRITIVDEGGAAIDVDGATIDWYLKESAGSAAALLHKATPTEVEIEDGDGGVVVVHIEPDDTEGLPAGKYFHGVVVALAGDVSTVTIGHMTLLPMVAAEVA